MSISSTRRLLMAALVAGGAVLGVAAPGIAVASPAPAGAVVTQPGDDDDDDDDNGRAPRGGVETGHGGAVLNQPGDDDDDDDNGQAPRGGVETGHGGTAGDDLLVPIGLAGGAALATGGAVFMARRQRGQGN